MWASHNIARTILLCCIVLLLQYASAHEHQLDDSILHTTNTFTLDSNSQSPVSVSELIQLDNTTPVIIGPSNDILCVDCDHQYNVQQPFVVHVTAQCDHSQSYTDTAIQQSDSQHRTNVPYVNVLHGNNQLSSALAGWSWLNYLPRYVSIH